MKRIKAVNSYTIMEATERDAQRYNVEAGRFYLYFSSDLRDFGLGGSDWEWEAGSIEEALEWCEGSNYAKAREIVEESSTCATFEEIVEVEAMLDAGMSEEEIEEAREAVEMVAVDDLRDGLDVGDYGEFLNDYRNSSAYISDAIMEIADNNVGIYYSQLLKFVSENPEALADVVEEGLYDPRHKYDFWDHARSAEFLVIERDIYNHLEDALMVAALDFIRYDLGREFIPEELAEYLQTWVTDPGDRMSDIPERITEFLEDYPC